MGRPKMTDKAKQEAAQARAAKRQNDETLATAKGISFRKLLNGVVKIIDNQLNSNLMLKNFFCNFST
jgi:hypothetical protein